MIGRDCQLRCSCGLYFAHWIFWKPICPHTKRGGVDPETAPAGEGMSFGKTMDRRRQVAKCHVRTEHICPRCYRKIRGNGYFNHKIACIDKNPTTGGFPAITTAQRKAERKRR